MSLQARPEIRRFPLFALLAWSMAAGAVIDAAIAFAIAGPPAFDTRPAYWAGLLYLALAASVLTFSLYYPVVRKIGPAKAAYSSVLVPIIAMGFSTWLEDYRWTSLTIAGARAGARRHGGRAQPKQATVGSRAPSALFIIASHFLARETRETAFAASRSVGAASRVGGSCLRRSSAASFTDPTVRAVGRVHDRPQIRLFGCPAGSRDALRFRLRQGHLFQHPHPRPFPHREIDPRGTGNQS